MTIRPPLLVLAAAAVLTVAAAPAAHAGTSLFGGVNWPAGDFNEGAKTGWALGGYYTTSIVPLVSVGGLVAYNDFSLASAEVPEFGELFGSTFNAWEVQALGNVNLLFLKGFLGLGVANYKGIDADGGDERKTKFGWQVGAAMQFMMLEGRLAYHRINADHTSPSWVGLTVGVVF